MKRRNFLTGTAGTAAAVATGVAVDAAVEDISMGPAELNLGSFFNDDGTRMYITTTHGVHTYKVNCKPCFPPYDTEYLGFKRIS